MMEQVILAEEQLGRNQMVAIASILDTNWTSAQLCRGFGAENAEILIRQGREMGYLEQRRGIFRFTMPIEKICLQDVTLSMMVRPVCCMLGENSDQHGLFQKICRQLAQIVDFSDKICVEFFNQVGVCAEQDHNLTLAAVIYNETIAWARAVPELSTRKTLLVRSVLNISKIEFMRGVSPRETLRHQREALHLVHQANLSAEDALLMLYAGMNEHFCGSIQEGTTLRESGIKYLDQFDCTGMEAEITPLVGWHYYLLGNFSATIAYYESLILAIETREDLAIVAFAYPPIIFSYTFLGEYHKALILAEKLHRNALKSQDHYAATLMLSNIGRTYVYMGDLEKAETVLYQAYAEALQQDYGWGLYYTLLGICYLQYKKENYFACREYLALAIKAAHEHGFNPINASPFLFDVLKMMLDRGLEPIEGISFQSYLQEGLASQNVHIAGVAYRFKTIQYIDRGDRPEIILKSIRSSIQKLEISGCASQLAQTYLVCARYYRSLNQEAEVCRYARLAWDNQTDDERKTFPRDLTRYIINKNVKISFATLLETLWLELGHIINPERLVAKLTTTLCRQLQAEVGAFLVRRGDKLDIVLAQNAERDPQSPQYQRIIAITTYVEQNAVIFSTQNAGCAVQEDLDLKRSPRFCACIPFSNGEKIDAMLFFESYYREVPLTQEERVLLEQFAAKLSPHLFATIEYQPDIPKKVQPKPLVYPIESAGNGKQIEYCPSIDENVLLLQTQIDKIAGTKVPVLITGETGTGKEVFCSEIYKKSGCYGPYIKVNCGAIPESLLESELFGYERGSFTGASTQKKGFFELANGGTLFLDEIGELPIQAQVKLLRVLQEHEFLRVGGTKPVKTDFRLIAATNKDLQLEVSQGTFRKDLYYRLNVIQFVIPPLRERKSDILNMARFFSNKFCRQIDRPYCQFSEDALSRMLDYDWPGNVRELENMVQRAVLLADSSVVTGQMLFQQTETAAQVPPKEKLVTLEEMERRYIVKVLKACGGRIAGPNGAAEILGMKRTTLNSKMERLGIRNTL